MASNKWNFKNFKPHTLELGENYSLYFFSRPIVCRLIKPTQQGFNFLDLKTSKCILMHHLYQSKYPAHNNNGQLVLFIPSYLQIVGVNHEEKYQNKTG